MDHQTTGGRGCYNCKSILFSLSTLSVQFLQYLPGLRLRAVPFNTPNLNPTSIFGLVRGPPSPDFCCTCGVYASFALCLPDIVNIII